MKRRLFESEMECGAQYNTMDYEILKNYFSLENGNGSIEFNLMKWSSNDAKFDLRRWSPSGKPEGGLTLTASELSDLYYALQECIEEDDEEDILSENETEQIPDVVIDYRSLVVVNNLFQCQMNGHDIEAVTALIYTRNSSGNVNESRIEAGFCQQCGAYYIKSEDYEKLRHSGRILCQVFSDMKKFEKYKKDVKYGNLMSESVLKVAGYTVSQTEDLSENERRNILLDVIDSGIKDKNSVISFLTWLINQNENNPSKKTAVQRWRSDRDWLSGKDNSLIGRTVTAKYIIDRR